MHTFSKGDFGCLTLEKGGIEELSYCFSVRSVVCIGDENVIREKRMIKFEFEEPMMRQSRRNLTHDVIRYSINSVTYPDMLFPFRTARDT